MKKHAAALTAIFALLIAGLVIFSCALDTGSYGTLLVELPGSGARNIVPGEYMAKLFYRITCTGPGHVTRDFRAGETASIPLAGGNWTVSVTVHINGSPKTIGASGARPVAIEVGKTSTARMEISIEANHCDITGFSVSGLPGHKIQIIEDEFEPEIRVLVPHEIMPANVITVPISVTHEGLYYETSYPPHSVIMLGGMESSPLTVYALDGITSKEYNVILDAIPYGAWPPSSIWAAYGLSGLAQPAGTVMAFPFEVFNGVLTLTLLNANSTAFNDFVNAIKTSPGVVIGSESSDPAFYSADYSINGNSENYFLDIFFDEAQGMLALSIAPVGIVAPSWPTDFLASFGLSPFPQPDFTNILSSLYSVDPENLVIVLSVDTLLEPNPEVVYTVIMGMLDDYYTPFGGETNDGYNRIKEYEGKIGIGSFGTTAILALEYSSDTITLTFKRL